MEKLEIEINSVVYPFGGIDRPGYSYDQYGYLIYSGIDENVTRADPKSTVAAPTYYRVLAEGENESAAADET
jgi:hypothetical protein